MPIPENVKNAGADLVLREVIKDERALLNFEKQIYRNVNQWRNLQLKNIENLVNELIFDENGVLRPVSENVRIMDELADLLENEIYDVQLKNMIDNIFRTINSRIVTLPRLLNNIGFKGDIIENRNILDLDVISAKINNISERITENADGVLEKTMSKLFTVRNTITSFEYNRKDIFDFLVQNTKVSPQHAFTVANTELMGIDRLSRKMQGDKLGFNEYKYLGPDDDLTRPFCAEHIGVVRDKSYWENVQNETGPNPVFEYCGGYNCRHRLVMWLTDWQI